jgi:endonuclease YncB( thermonuclease family)
VVLVALLAASIPARADPCTEGPSEPVWVERTPLGDEVVLTDGRHLVLASLEAPRGPLGSGPDRTVARRLAGAARDALADAVEGLEIGFVDLGVDRWGRHRARLIDPLGHSIAAGLVAAGRVRVIPGRDDRACVASLVAVEAGAIAAHRGLWAERPFAVRSAGDTDLAAIVGHFTVIEGRVVSVGHSGSRTYLDFGTDFRRDFAVVLNDKDLDGIVRRGLDIGSLRGRRVRVRGIVEGRGAPRIVVETPEAIELLTR